MLVKDCMNARVICCTAWDPVWTAATLMKKHGIGAVAVVSDISDPLLEGIVTDRDLCCAVVAAPKLSCPIRIADVMTRVPVTCRADDTLAKCQELMRENQVRRVPVVNERGRCVGIVTQTELAVHATTAELAATVRAISDTKPTPQFDGNPAYSGPLPKPIRSHYSILAGSTG